MLVFGFSVILLSIFPPLVNGPSDGQTEGQCAHDRHDLRGERAHGVQRPSSGEVVVIHRPKPYRRTGALPAQVPR